MGESDKPLGRYTTTQIAEDTLELLNHLDWSGKRELHVIGVSMGGMIAQELVWFSLESKKTLRQLTAPPGAHDSQ